MSDFYLGLFGGLFFYQLLEFLFLNFIYLKNIGLFLDLFVTKKNQDRLKEYFKKES